MNARLMIIIAGMFFVSVSYVQGLELPENIQQIISYNENQALEFMQTISFPIAFLAGILSILSPCILPLLPAFFAYSFKEKKNNAKMTFVFFLGFSLIFVILGLIAGALGQSLVGVQQNYSFLVLIAGIFLVIFGIMSLAGKGFASILRVNKKFSNDVPGIFLFGVVFAVGWSACLGPILGGILLISSALGNFFYSGLLLFVYSLGIFVPLFILSLFFDKYNLTQNRWVKGKMFEIGKHKIHSTNMISGLLFILIGVAFLVFRGTSFVNDLDLLGTKTMFYDLQRLLVGSNLATIVGIGIFISMVSLAIVIYKKRNGHK